jgi:hypothetical protein
MMARKKREIEMSPHPVAPVPAAEQEIAQATERPAEWVGYDSEPPLAARVVAAQERRVKQIAIANLIRSNGGLTHRTLSNVAIAYRVGGVLPSDVQAVRERLEEQGYLQEELDQGEQKGGESQ